MHLSPICALIALPGILSASNINVSNVRTMSNTGNSMAICFDITWDYSWRTTTAAPNNWDAAWVFAKYRTFNAGTRTWSAWSHAKLNNTGHVVPTGAVMQTGLQNPGSQFNISTNPGIGVFMYRDADGTGTVTWNNACMDWNFSTDGQAQNAIFQVRVFAIEMVYVPTATYNLGDGVAGGNTTGYGATTVNSATVFPATACCGTGNNYELNKISGGGSIPIAAAYPNGYTGFYMMKNLITQRGYRDFLNTLTRAQQSVHHRGTAVGHYMAAAAGQTTPLNRNGIVILQDDGTSPRVYACNLNTTNAANAEDDGQNIACNFVNYFNVYSYLDWAGLRPMTNMEFEKAARGPSARVANEYPWGTTSASRALTLTNSGTAAEGASEAAANVVWDQMAQTTGPQGPVRVGSFATASSTREQAGAGYYGGLNMADNLHDFCINLTTVGRVFTGVHGNGVLNASGYYDEANWPDGNVTVLPNASTPAVSVKGSCWMHGTAGAQTSRHLADDAGGGTSIAISFFYGGRGVRTAP